MNVKDVLKELMRTHPKEVAKPKPKGMRGPDDGRYAYAQGYSDARKDIRVWLVDELGDEFGD